MRRNGCHPGFLATLIVLASLRAPAPASSRTLFGSIGKRPVALFLDAEDQGRLNGWYVYLDRGKEIEIAGARGDDGVVSIEERVGGKPTGRFKGAVEGPGWVGQWTSADGKSRLPFTLRDVDGGLSRANASVKCASRRPDGRNAYVYDHDLSLRIARGEVKVFAFSRTASSRSDQQSCQIELDALRQAPDKAGILLTTDVGDGAAEKSNACEIRIVGDASHLVVRMGDCRSANDEAFCSARGMWTDMIVDRETGRCIPLE